MFRVYARRAAGGTARGWRWARPCGVFWSF
jgi:hypothetical protein